MREGAGNTLTGKHARSRACILRRRIDSQVDESDSQGRGREHFLGFCSAAAARVLLPLIKSVYLNELCHWRHSAGGRIVNFPFTFRSSSAMTSFSRRDIEFLLYEYLQVERLCDRARYA